MIKPNLFIVGGARCGTSFLWSILKSHPQIFMPKDELHKEPAFFSKKGEKMGLDKYLQLFENPGADKLYVGEASTAYLTDPASPEKIIDYNPDSKIIVLLRNPVRRAYSMYNWMVQDGYEYSRTFDDALGLEEKRSETAIPNYFEPEYFYNYMYRSYGMYSEPVSRYLSAFKDNVIVILFEHFINDTETELKKLYDFLEVEYNNPVKTFTNRAGAVKSAPIQFVLRKVVNFLVENDFYKNDQDYTWESISRKLLQVCENHVSKLSVRCQITDDEIQLIRDFIRKYLDDNYGDTRMFGMNGKKSRDLLLTYGMLDQSPVQMVSVTMSRLKSAYTSEVLKLEKMLKKDLSFWMG